MGQRVELRFADAGALEQHWREHLSRGGAWLAGQQLARDLACELLLIAPGGASLAVAARVVFADGNGTGLAIDGFGPELRERIEALMHTSADSSSRDSDADADADADAAHTDDKEDVERDPVARNIHERLRGLTLVQQLEVARKGETPERIVLERMYGKSVWDALLHNSRLSHAEVARIARMGNLPRPLVELIVGNAAWLKSPEVRRALLSNPRLQIDQAGRVLRLMSRQELKLAMQTPGYPPAVRDTARRLLHGVP